MKIKSIIAILAVSAASVFGQGLVNFQNSTISSPIRINDGSNSLLPTTGTWDFFFKYGTSAGNLNFTSPSFANSTTAGRIAGNTTLSLSTSGGTPIFAQLYATGTVNSVTYGYLSSVITVTPSTAPSPGTPMFGAAVGTQFQGFTMQPIPEPSTIALGSIGLASLLFLRRRNS